MELVKSNDHTVIICNKAVSTSQDDEVIYVNCFKNDDEVITTPGLPKLTEMHLLETFMESGITYGGVTSLAVSLDIKNDQTFLRRCSIQPSCLAMMVVKKWLDMKDPTLEEAHQELEKQLRFLDLSKAIPKLQGRRNPSETDPAIVRELLQEQARYFSVSQAYSFGILVGLKEGKIDDLVRSRQLNRGIDVVLCIFDHIEASTTHFDYSKLSEIIEALVHVAENSEEICSPIVIVPRIPRSVSTMNITTANLVQNNNMPRVLSEINLTKLTCTSKAQAYRTLILPSKVSEDGPSIASSHSAVNGNQDEVMTVPKKYGNNFNCYNTNMSTINYCKGFFIGMIVMNSIVTFLLLLTIMLLLAFPQIPLSETQVVFLPTDVIKYNLPISSYWLSYLQVRLRGSFDSGSCSVEVLSVRCTDVQLNKTLPQAERRINYLYMEEGSSAMLKLSDPDIDYNCYNINFYYIWIFTSQNEANDNSNTNFDRFACADHSPNNIWCKRLDIVNGSTSFNFTAPKSSYYFIRCSFDPNCTLLAETILSSTNYINFESTKSNPYRIHSINLQLGETGMLPINDYLSLTEGKICVVLQLQSTCSSSEYEITFDGRKRYDIVLYPSFFLLIFSVLLIVLITIACCYRKPKN